MGLYDRLKNEKLGEAVKVQALAAKKGEEMADQKLAEAEAIAQQRLMQEMQQARGGSMPGRMAAQQGGLGFNNVDRIQNQADVHNQAMNQAAMEVLQMLHQADAQGASPQEIEAILQKTPPELQGRVLQLMQMEMEQNATQGMQPGGQPGAGQPMPQQMAPQRPDPRTMHLQGNPVTQYAQQLAMEQDQQQQPLPSQQQMY